MRGPDRGERRRGISPVVGVALMLGIVVVLVGVSAVLLFGLAEEPDPAPTVALDFEEGQFSPVHLLTHNGGDPLGGNGKTKIQGIANPEVLHDRELTAGQERDVIPVVPIDEEIEVVWYGDDGTSYVLQRFSPSSYLEVAPDEDCEWVENETGGGSDPITVDGVVVNCNIITEGDIGAVNGAVVVGNTTSTKNNLDLDESVVYGPIGAEGDVDLDETNVSGSVTSDGDDVVLTNASHVGGGIRIGSGGNVDVDGNSSVGGTIEAGNRIDVDSTTVDGDLVSDGGTIDVTNSTVGGEIRTGGDVDLDGATVSGHVSVGGTFSCSDSTINGQDCGEYTPQSP